MILSKNDRNEAIARAWAALVAAIVYCEDAPQSQQEACEERILLAMSRAVKALGMERKIKPKQTHRLVDYVNELVLIGLLTLLMEERGVELPASIAESEHVLKDIVKQFVRS